MRIGINASFSRKPGTGIGQVTVHFVQKLIERQESKSDSQFILYTEEPINVPLPANFENKHFLPRYWKRDDLIRQWLWERQVGHAAVKDNCNAFISLYQSSTNFRTTRNKKQPTIRHTMVVHDIIPRLFPAYRGNLRQALRWKMVERGIAQADHIVAVSEHTQDDLIGELGILKNKISVAYPSIASRFHDKLSQTALLTVLQKYHLTAGYIYHGGGLEIRKNTEALLRAYKQLLANEQPSTTGNSQPLKKIPPLIISGNIHSKSNKLATDAEKLIRDLGLEQNVRLLGFVPDVDMPGLYQGALFFVYPSLYEGFGLPVLEALTLGTPTLTSAVSSLPEVGGNAVIYTDPENIEDLTRQMTRLLNDEDLRATLTAKSAEQARLFNWESFVRSILETLEKS